MKKIYWGLLLFIVVLPGCPSRHARYAGWEYVRIEYEVPNRDCEYKIQEACSSGGARCFNWFKQKATLYGANTVVITERSQGFVSKGKAFVGQYAGGAKSSATSTMTGLADYYYCPSKDRTNKLYAPLKNDQ